MCVVCVVCIQEAGGPALEKKQWLALTHIIVSQMCHPMLVLKYAEDGAWEGKKFPAPKTQKKLLIYSNHSLVLRCPLSYRHEVLHHLMCAQLPAPGAETSLLLKAKFSSF